MTFSCPNFHHDTGICQRLDKLCVAGRPGCVLQDKVDFGEDIDVRIARAEERVRNKRQRETNHILPHK